MTGPSSTLKAARDLAMGSFHSPSSPEGEPHVKWFRFYDGPMRSADEVAILCHLEPSTHVETIRRTSDPVPSPARYEPWHYPACIEVLEGSYELSVSFFSRKTVEQGLTAKTTTTESTTPSTAQWQAEAGSVYVLAAAIGKSAPAPGDGPAYRVRRKTKELFGAQYKLEVSHWKAAIVKLASRSELDQPIEAHREAWRHHEANR